KEMQKARLRFPIIEELESAVRVTLLHELLASPDQQIVEYLREHGGTIQNKKAREITGKESSQAIYKVFLRLIAAGVIELVNPGCSVYEREYRLTGDWQRNWSHSAVGKRSQNRSPKPSGKEPMGNGPATQHYYTGLKVAH